MQRISSWCYTTAAAAAAAPAELSESSVLWVALDSLLFGRGITAVCWEQG